MRVHLVKEKTIEDFIAKHADSRIAFKMWLSLIRTSDWSIPNNVLETFGSADLLGNGSERAVFNIAGNRYRLIAKYDFAKTRVHLTICWIGTHAEYTRLCRTGNQYDIRAY
jgi:mRNA interferase HigB